MPTTKTKPRPKTRFKPATPDEIAMGGFWGDDDLEFLAAAPWRSFDPGPLHDPDPPEMLLAHFIKVHRPPTINMDLFFGQLHESARETFPAGLEVLLHAGWLRQMGGFRTNRDEPYGVYRINPDLLAYIADPRKEPPEPSRDTEASRLDRTPLACAIMLRMGMYD